MEYNILFLQDGCKNIIVILGCEFLCLWLREVNRYIYIYNDKLKFG